MRFGQAPLAHLRGGALIVAGGLLMAFWKAERKLAGQPMPRRCAESMRRHAVNGIEGSEERCKPCANLGRG